MNLPNRITCGRLFLAAVLFALLETWCRNAPGGGAPWTVAFVLYLLIVVSDGLDGYLARARNQITAFGRIADPFADKVVIGGVLVLSLSLAPTIPLVPSWLVLIVLAREFLVSGLRGYLEGRGTGFAARWEGKAKMILQAIYCGAVLFYPATHFAWVHWITRAGVWVTAVVTVWSAASYVRKASEVILSGKDA